VGYPTIVGGILQELCIGVSIGALLVRLRDEGENNMSDRKLLPGKFVWFEHVSKDAKKATTARSNFCHSAAS
jgi:hypothetical protein